MAADDADAPPPAEDVAPASAPEESMATTEEGVPAVDAAEDDDDAAVTGATVALSSLAVAASSAPTPPANESNPPPPAVEDVVDDDDDDDEDYDPAADPDADEDDEDDEDDVEAYANEFLSLLPPCVLPRIERLKSLNAKRDALMEEYRAERAALELKYVEKIGPLYDERRDVVNGEYDMAIQEEKWEEDNETKKKKKEGDDEADDGEAVPPAGEAVKGIPQFWACAMGHVDVVAELITEADVDCLEHLTDVTCTDFPDGLGFELNFHFSPNEFFSNSVLSKRYEVPNLLTEDEPILKNVTGTDIRWKTGRSLTYREVTKKQRKKGGRQAGQVRSITKRERTESFFHFFTPMKMPAMMDVVDEDEADAVEEAFDHDYDVAQAFRNHLIKKAVLWFTGEAMMEDDYDDEGMMGGEEDEGDDGDDNEPFPRPVAGDGENPECKQN